MPRSHAFAYRRRSYRGAVTPILSLRPPLHPSPARRRSDFGFGAFSAGRTLGTFARYLAGFDDRALTTRPLQREGRAEK